jgi:hypothetical protein
MSWKFKASPARRDRFEKSQQRVLNLVNSDIGRRNKFAPPVHAPGAATVRKVLQCLAALVDGLHRFAGCGWVVFRDALEYTFQVVRSECRPPNFHRQLPSGIEQLVESLSNLLVREIFTALQGSFAEPDGFNKAGLFREIPADRLLGEGIRITASLCGKFRKLMLLLRSQMYFHIRQSRGHKSDLSTSLRGGFGPVDFCLKIIFRRGCRGKTKGALYEAKSRHPLPHPFLGIITLARNSLQNPQPK